MEIVSVSEDCKRKEFEASDPKVKDTMPPEKIHEGSSSFLEKLGKAKIDSASRALLPLEVLESTDENDLHTPPYETGDVATKILSLDHAHEVGSNFQQDVETFAVRQSLTNSKDKRYRMKGKAKALSNEIMSNENRSHESVESCNSADLSSSTKKRRRSETQLTIGRKSSKMKVQGTPGSRQDSSFMNWISSMINGFLKSDQCEPFAPAHILETSNQELKGRDQKLISYNRNQVSGSNFQSVFRSLCPKMKPLENLSEERNHKMGDINTTPTACPIVSEEFLLSNEKINESASGNGAHPPAQIKDISKNISDFKDKDGAGSNSSQDKCNKKIANSTDSEPPFEGKTAHNLFYKSDPVASSWITWFTSKTSGPLLNQDTCNRSIREAPHRSTNGMRLIPQLHPDCQKIIVVNEDPTNDPVQLESCTDAEASFGFCKVKCQHDEKSVCKLGPVLPFRRSKSSSVMASVFARRSDALKHSLPSTVAANSSRAFLTCIFCGIKRNHLQDFSEITGEEHRDLQKNMNSNYQPEELPCVCIRCFPNNNWAVACPNASSKVRGQGQRSASLIKKGGLSKLQLGATNVEISKLSNGRGGQLQAAGACADFNVRDPGDKSLNLIRKLNEVASSAKVEQKCKLFENDTVSLSKENRPDRNHITGLSYLVNTQISEVPNEVFDAVKRLRLSRTDILRWMNSVMPFSQIDGLFLRLRLGKWEEGLGGTGYYVACISGIQTGSSTQETRNSIAVDIGGIKCPVESQCISNHDFLEDELMAWWSTTLRRGGKIPSEQDLRLKLREKRALGF